MKSSRMCQITIALTALTVVGLVSAPPVAAATLYSLLDLGTLGGDSSRANGINNLGQVVGSSTIASGDTRAFRTEPNSPINPATDNLGTLAGDRSSVGLGINDLGQVVGGAEYPFLPFPPSGGGAFRTAPNSPINPATDNLGNFGVMNAGAVATGINNLGQVVGTSAFLYSNRFFTPATAFRTAPNSPINPATDSLSNELLSSASGINDLGQVVGSYEGLGAYRTAPNSPLNPATDLLGSLGSLGVAAANAINNLGQVVGGSYTGSTTAIGEFRAFRTAPNSRINPATDDLGTLGGTSSTAYAINNLGQVVGSSTTTSGDTHAFLYDDGSLLDLNNLIPANSGFVLTVARGINDVGQIAGDGLINGQTHAFLATPVPEPNSALYTLAFGVLTTGFVLKRSRK